MAENDETLAPRERVRFVVVLIIAALLMMFLLIIVLNAGTILVGAVLTIFHVILAIILIALAGVAVLWLADRLLKAIGEAESRLKAELDSLRKTALQATYKSGSELITFATSILLYFVQEYVAEYRWPYRVAIRAREGLTKEATSLSNSERSLIADLIVRFDSHCAGPGADIIG